MKKILTRIDSVFHPYRETDREGNDKYFMKHKDPYHRIYKGSESYGISFTWLGCFTDLVILNLLNYKL